MMLKNMVLEEVGFVRLMLNSEKKRSNIWSFPDLLTRIFIIGQLLFASHKERETVDR
jgi:hypothetical protein